MRLVVGFLTMAVTATLASAGPVEAQRHFAGAQQHYTAGRYDEALVELQAAQVADPQPEYLWAIAQAYRLKGDCAHAIAAYGAYLRTGPKPEATKATQMLIDRCVAAQEAQVPAPTITPAPSTTPPAEPLVIREVQRVHTREVTLPWYRDTWGNLLVGSGVGSLVIGAVALVRADWHDARATTSVGYQAFDDEQRARDRAQLVGGAAIATGGALVVAGLLHYALRPKRVRTDVLIDPATGAAGVAVSWGGW